MAEKLHTRYPGSTLIRVSMADNYSNVQMLKTHVKTEIKISKLEIGYLYITFFIIHQMFCGILANTAIQSTVCTVCVCVHCTLGLVIFWVSRFSQLDNSQMGSYI